MKPCIPRVIMFQEVIYTKVPETFRKVWVAITLEGYQCSQGITLDECWDHLVHVTASQWMLDIDLRAKEKRDPPMSAPKEYHRLYAKAKRSGVRIRTCRITSYCEHSWITPVITFKMAVAVWRK